MDCAFEEFAARLTAENHTLKRSLTDPHILSGIGNAYSDEILLYARLSPVTLSRKSTPPELARLLDAIRDRLNYFTGLLRRQTGAGFPEKVTAFRPEMAAHGKFNQPWRAPRELSTVPTNPTTARPAKPAENYWLIGPCPGCWVGTGPSRWRHWSSGNTPIVNNF